MKRLVSAFGLTLLITFIPSVVIGQSDAAQTACDGITATGATCGDDTGINDVIVAVVNVLLYVVGVAAVIVIIIGAIRYVTSQGDSQAAASARQTIIYAVIGMVIAIMSFAIVNFVLDGGSSGSSGNTNNNQNSPTFDPTGTQSPPPGGVIGN
jgi:hypothetical protein